MTALSYTAPIWQRRPMPADHTIAVPQAERSSTCTGVNNVNLSRDCVLESVNLSPAGHMLDRVNLSPAGRMLDGVNLSPAWVRMGGNNGNLSLHGGTHG